MIKWLRFNFLKSIFIKIFVFSILHIVHNLRFAYKNNLSFERSLLDSVNGLFIMLPDTIDLRMVTKLMQQKLPKLSKEDIHDILDFGMNLKKYSYVFLSQEKIKNFSVSKLRFDIFNLNLILMPKFE